MTTKTFSKRSSNCRSSNFIEVVYVQHLAHAEKSTLPSEPNPVSDPLAEFIGSVPAPLRQLNFMAAKLHCYLGLAYSMTKANAITSSNSGLSASECPKGINLHQESEFY